MENSFFLDLVNTGIAIYRNFENSIDLTAHDIDGFINNMQQKGAENNSNYANQLRELPRPRKIVSKAVRTKNTLPRFM